MKTNDALVDFKIIITFVYQKIIKNEEDINLHAINNFSIWFFSASP